MNFKHRYLAGACAAALALACGGEAGAQAVSSPTASTGSATATVTEVVVTAERRTTNLQKTAIAATVLTQTDLTKGGVITIDQLQFVTPSLTVNNFGQGNNVDIRGIGKGEHNSRTDTGVVDYRDGVATFPGFFQEEPYFDVADVAVLRGPQGTFSGQDATGGAVVVNTQNPKIGGGYDGYLLGSYGNYNDVGTQGAVNLPISDTLAARVAFNGENRDSFYHISGIPSVPELYWGSARISVLWTPTSSLRVLFKTDYDYLDNGGYFGDAIINPVTHALNPTNNLYSFANNYKTPYATDQFVRSILRIDYTDSSTGIDFRSMSSYQQGRTGFKGDVDGSTPPDPNYTIVDAANETIYSQEFNIISPDKGPLGWILGAYYQYDTYNFPLGWDVGTPPGAFDEDLIGNTPYYTDAVFGQVSYKLPDGFEVQAGVRYSNWYSANHVTYYIPEIPADDFHENQSTSGSNVTGKVTLNWTLDANNFLYAFVATGAKPGAPNTALYLDHGLVPPAFKQEYVTDYEVGWKSSFFDNHIRTQLGGYYSDYSNFQVYLADPVNPTQSTEINIPNPSILYGLEGSTQAVFGDFKLNTSIGLEHTALGQVYAEDSRVLKAGSCNLATGPVSTACINLKGHAQTYAPSTTFNIGVQYNFHVAGNDLVTPGVNFAYVSNQWGTVFDNAALGDQLAARRILGATLAWTHGDIVATLYGHNLTNDQYVSALYPPIRFAGAPRQFGISVMKSF